VSSNTPKCIPIYIQQDATLHSLFYLETALHISGRYLHPSSEAQTTVSTASGICHTVTATCRYSRQDGVQQQHVQQPYTYAKPEAANAVLGS
jgi:hypothetical protein